MHELKPERFGLAEFTSQPVSICGKSFLADMSGALFWPARRSLIIADLDVACPRAGVGNAPPRLGPDIPDVLGRLAAAIDRLEAETVVVLGTGIAGADGIDIGEGVVLGEDNRKTLMIMQDHCQWIWVSDTPVDREAAHLLGGERRDVFRADGLTFCHRPAPGLATHEIAGGIRPAARISRHGHEIRRPCFIGDGLRMIVPAFATYSGGTNILDQAFGHMFGSNGFSVWMLGHEGLYPIAPRLLIPD